MIYNKLILNQILIFIGRNRATEKSSRSNGHHSMKIFTTFKLLREALIMHNCVDTQMPSSSNVSQNYDASINDGEIC